MKKRINILSILSVILLLAVVMISRLDVNINNSQPNTREPIQGILKTDGSEKALTETSVSLLPAKELKNISADNGLLSLGADYENLTGEKALPKEHRIEDFDIILQLPELPTGCEITSMTMVLNYYGLKADKVTMATKYLPAMPANLYYDSDGNLYGSNLNKYFIGDPTTAEGYVCGTQAILTAANKFLSKQKSSLAAVDKTGASPDELYRLVAKNTPVVVWVTIYMQQRDELKGWHTEDGEYVEWSSNDHGAVLIGYTEDTVIIADPISGSVEYSRQDFEKVFASRGNQCVILQ